MNRFIKALIPAGLSLTLVGAVTYGILAESGWKAMLPLAAGIVLVIGASIYGFRSTSSEGSMRSLRLGINAAISILALAAILIFLQTILSNHGGRLDTTSNRRYSLSEQTLKILENLKREVSITAFLKQETPEKREVEDLLKSYSSQSRHIKFSLIDPDRDPVMARRFNVTRYGTIVIESGENQEQIFNATEEKITNAIVKVTREKRKVIYCLTGHGEKSIEDRESSGLDQLKSAVEAESYEIKSLLAMRDSLPQDCSVLVIAGPERDLFPIERDMIERYLENGGALLALIDPIVELPLIDSLVAKFGIELTESIVVDRFGKLVAGNYLTPVVNTYGNHPIAENFRLASFFPQARAIAIASPQPSGVNAAVLASTSPSAYAETDLQSVLSKGMTQFDADKDIAGPIDVAAVATRDLYSGKNRSRIAVFGDSDFTSNAYLSLSGNKDLILNTLGWLAEEEDLIAIRAKDPVSQPVVLTLKQGRIIFWLPVVALPAAFMLVGTLVVIAKRRS